MRRHSVVAYFVLFAVTWAGEVIVLGPTGIVDTTVPEAQTERLLPLVMAVTMLGPAVAGLALTGLTSGIAGYRDLLARLRNWRMAGRWWAVALLAAPLSVSVSLAFVLLMSSGHRPAIMTSTSTTTVLAFGLIWGLLVGLFEELGWTGFAIPRMRLRHSMLTTGLVVGLLWGLWHLPVNYWGIASQSGTLPLALVLAVSLFSWLPPYRVLMVWVYDRTQSLLW